ncbi:DNA internalization-related protein competence protein ComEC/Rec2 [Rubellimicrobium mesophilum DSM 19309]|uniref:DNA internalization-related protein competence protein ComEC/Rec2 n=1 Tax=Rubellimicrobium mesophilum DSM 19309 TaxID=442562 RepID=A0A017HQ15_9RHOB|nr:DNA internalization-related protein competence protein ComEC/Rec2 [Rubellimicrobium mesophilum DSM 19309]
MELADHPDAGTSGPRLGRWWSRAEAALLAQRGQLLSWAPVALGTGIGIYFALPVEPETSAWTMLGIAVILLLLTSRAVAPALAPLLLGLALVGAGAGLAGWRAWAVAAPVLDFRYYGPVEGRILGIDRSASDALRLTLDHVVLEDVPPERTPASVRVSLRGDQRWLVPEPGRVVILTGNLSPPSGPPEPGDFDFRRAAWFEGLGATGWTETPVLAKAPSEGASGSTAYAPASARGSGPASTATPAVSRRR